MTGNILAGDGRELFVYLPSMVLDGDLDFKNQMADLHDQNPRLFADYGFNPDNGPIIRTGSEDTVFEAMRYERYNDEKYYGFAHHTIGAAFFWLPAYLVGIAFGSLIGYGVNGITPLIQYITFISSIVYALSGFYLMEKLGIGLDYSKVHLRLSTSAIIFGSFILQYISVEPSMNHAIDLFIGTAFFFQLRKTMSGGSKDHLILGAISGLAICVRPQNIIFLGIGGLAIAFKSLWEKRTRILPWISFSLATVIFSTPLIISYKLMFGSFLDARGEAGFLDYLHPKVFEVLFSTRHSLFVTTPLLFIAIIGFLLYLRNARSSSIDQGLFLGSICLAFVLMLYFNSLIVDWWGGSTPGARRFSGIMILFHIGLANILKRFGTLAYALVALLIAFNLVWIGVFNLNMVDPHGYVGPYDVIQAFWGLLMGIFGH